MKTKKTQIKHKHEFQVIDKTYINIGTPLEQLAQLVVICRECGKIIYVEVQE